MKANAHNQEMSDKKNHEARATKMVEDIAALKKRLTELVAGNKEKEQTLRKVRGAYEKCNRENKKCEVLHYYD